MRRITFLLFALPALALAQGFQPDVVTRTPGTLTGVGNVIPDGDGTRDLGSGVARFRRLYATAVYDATIQRISLVNTAETTIVGNKANGAGAFGLKLGANTLLTPGVDRYIVGFYNDAVTTPQLYITSNGSIISANDATSQLGSATVAWTNVYSAILRSKTGALLAVKGSIADGAGAIGVKIGNTAALADATAEPLAIYNDDVTTKVAAVSATGAIKSVVGTFLSSGTDVPAITRGAAADGAAAIGVKLSNSIALANAAAKVVAFYPDAETTEVASVGIAGTYNSKNGTFAASGAADTSAILRGNAADGAAAIGVKISNAAALANGTAEIAAFYSDAETTKVAYVLPTGRAVLNGGVQPAATGGAITWTQTATHAALDLADQATAGCTADTTEAIVGTVLTDHCMVSSAIATETGGFYICRATNADEVKWRFCNLSGGNINRAPDTYTITVMRGAP